jgi:protein TonB
VARGSGHAELDALALELLARAQPLPPPPEGVAGDSFEMVVPVRYALK